MRRIRWTRRAHSDLAAVESFISEDSTRYAQVVTSRITAAIERAAEYPNAGRVVPELDRAEIREVIHSPYRIVYRLVGTDELHVLTVHHSSHCPSWYECIVENPGGMPLLSRAR